jgi:hypothetical protein
MLFGAKSKSTQSLAVRENRDMKNHGMGFLGGLLFCVLVLGGCQSDISLSRAVRTGDTLVVSLGDANPYGEDANINTILLREVDVVAKMIDNNYSTHPVRVRHIFRVYGDPTAVYGRVRGQAQWMAVIDLVNPLSGHAPSLALGNGVIRLESDKFSESQTVSTTIIAGTGAPHPFISKNEPVNIGLDKLEYVKPATQALVSVSGTLPQDVKLAGAEYRFDLPAVHSTDLLGYRVEAVAPAKLTTSQQIYFEFKRTERQAPAGTEVLVVLTSTEGVDQASLSAFNFVMISDMEAISNNPSYWENKLTRANFYDTNGQEIAGLMGHIGKNL